MKNQNHPIHFFIIFTKIYLYLQMLRELHVQAWKTKNEIVRSALEAVDILRYKISRYFPVHLSSDSTSLRYYPITYDAVSIMKWHTQQYFGMCLFGQLVLHKNLPQKTPNFFEFTVAAISKIINRGRRSTDNFSLLTSWISGSDLMFDRF